MKTILTATDFSKTGNNAVNYAANLALVTKSKLILFHAYHSPELISEAPAISTREDFQLEEKSNEQFDLMVSYLIKCYGSDLDIEYISISGFASDEITDIAKKKNIDLVVIGTHESEEGTNHFWNNTIEILRHTYYPVLIIPQKWEFQVNDTIVYATDLLKIKEKSILTPFLEIATLFDSKILVYNTNGDKARYSLQELMGEGIELEEIFQSLKHTFSISTNENIVESIIEFAELNKSGLIVMIKRQHNLFHRLFSKSNTEQMALKTKTPILILREGKSTDPNYKNRQNEYYSNN